MSATPREMLDAVKRFGEKETNVLLQLLQDFITKDELTAQRLIDIEQEIELLKNGVEPPILYPPVIAFPSAKGAGKQTTGGRGGVVVKVTNLNDAGAGSLREALMMTVPRTIIFDVSGHINLTANIELIADNGDFTIAGQTAPEGGITITANYIQLGGGYNRPSQPCDNVIIRYVRFRNGGYTGAPDVGAHNGIISRGTQGLVIDHCSFSFCDDQALTAGGFYGNFQNVTVQNCIFSENATGAIAGRGDQSFVDGNVTYTNNLWTDQTHRTPNFGGDLQYDLINNVYSNWKSRLSVINGSPNINFIGNYLREGSFTDNNNNPRNQIQSGNPVIYSADNYDSVLYPTPSAEQTLLFQLWGTNVNDGVPNASRFTSSMFPILGSETPLTSLQARELVLSDVGANKYLNADGTFGVYQDSFDIHKIENFRNNINENPSNKSWTIPTVPNNTRDSSYDTNGDGIPDSWEGTVVGTVAFDSSTMSSADISPSGYTWIEEYINGI